MSILRWLGLLVGIGVFLHSFARFRDARASRFDFGLGFFFSLSLIVISAFPDSVNLLRDMLMLEHDQFSRLLAVLIASNVVLWLLMISARARALHHADHFDRLVRSLGVSEFRRRHPDLERLPPVVVVIPAYDEAANVGAVIAAMPESVCDRALAPLVVDDGSEDDTAGAARRAGALVVESPVNRGGGAALRLGFDIAIEYGAEIVVTMDADGQHLPAEIEGLVRLVVDGEFAFVIGSRILGHHERDNRLRWAGIHFFNSVIRLLTPVKISDCSNGFRALRVAELSQVLLRQDQFHTAELIIEAAKRGIAIGEAPVTVKRRMSGESKKGRDFRYGLSFARTVIKTWWRY